MAKILSFPEKVRIFGTSQREPSLDAAYIDTQLSDLMSKLNRLEIGDSNHDFAVAIFVISVALSHAQTALQLISDSSLKQQFEDKLREINELLQAARAKTRGFDHSAGLKPFFHLLKDQSDGRKWSISSRIGRSHRAGVG